MGLMHPAHFSLREFEYRQEEEEKGFHGTEKKSPEMITQAEVILSAFYPVPGEDRIKSLWHPFPKHFGDTQGLARVPTAQILPKAIFHISLGGKQ